MTLLRQIHRRIPILSPITQHSHASGRTILCSFRNYSESSSRPSNTANGESQKSNEKSSEDLKPKQKTQAELDAEVMEKLQGLDSEGGAAGVEYEDGKPTSMKRSVRNNMFRYI